MKVVFIRSNSVMPDPRVEKEVNTLLKHKFNVKILAWNREYYGRKTTDIKNIGENFVEITWFNIRGTFGGGMKKNLFPLLFFQVNVFIWLVKNRKKYDVIHACDFDTVLPALLIKLLFKKDYIYDIFDYYVDAFNIPIKFKKVIEKVDHIAINKSTATIICSEERTKQIARTTPRKLIVIHNTPDLDLFSDIFEQEKVSSQKMNEDKIKFVYVGILSENRFLRELIDILKNKSHCELHIGGFGKLENYISEISKKYSNIKFYGRLDYSDTILLEEKCNIMTAIYDPEIPNHKYAAPNKFYEALMLGKPLIMINNTGMDYIIKENKIGYVADYNKKSVENAIDYLIDNKNLWSEMSSKMQEIYKSQYSWSVMEVRLINLYKSIEKEHINEKNNFCL